MCWYCLDHFLASCALFGFTRWLVSDPIAPSYFLGERHRWCHLLQHLILFINKKKRKGKREYIIHVPGTVAADVALDAGLFHDAPIQRSKSQCYRYLPACMLMMLLLHVSHWCHVLILSCQNFQSSQHNSILWKRIITGIVRDFQLFHSQNNQQQQQITHNHTTLYRLYRYWKEWESWTALLGSIRRIASSFASLASLQHPSLVSTITM